MFAGIKILKIIMENNIFYSEDWRQEVFAFGSLPFFDIMIDKEYLYMIKMPRWRPTGLKENSILVGSLFTGLGLLGAYAVGDARKRKYYKTYRSSWISPDHNLISQDYEKDIFLKIPLSELKNNFKLSRNKFVVIHNKNKITLIRETVSLKLQKSTDPEFTRLSQYLEKYLPIESAQDRFTIA